MLVQMPSARKGNWSQHNVSECADSQAFGDRELTLLLPQAVLWICSPSAPTNSLQMKPVDHLTVSGWLKQSFPVNSPSSTLLLTLLLCGILVSLACLSILSSFSLHSLFLATFFHICVLFSVACPALLFNVTLLFSLKFPLPWPKSLGHTALQVWATIPERSLNEHL